MVAPYDGRLVYVRVVPPTEDSGGGDGADRRAASTGIGDDGEEEDDDSGGDEDGEASGFRESRRFRPATLEEAAVEGGVHGRPRNGSDEDTRGNGWGSAAERPPSCVVPAPTAATSETETKTAEAAAEAAAAAANSFFGNFPGF